MWPVRSRMARPYLFKLREGTSFLTPRDLNFQLLWREVWIDEVYAQAGIQITDEATVVDIGANIGIFCLWAAARCKRGRVIAVEPSPRMADFLCQNAARNGRSITVLRVACGGNNGEGVLYTPFGDEARNTLDAPGPSIPARVLAEVEIVTLSEVFKRAGIDRCDLLKMDCEGSEYQILLNSSTATLDRIQQIALEYHPGFDKSETPERLEQLLRDHGFRVLNQPLSTQGYGYIYAVKWKQVV